MDNIHSCYHFYLSPKYVEKAIKNRVEMKRKNSFFFFRWCYLLNEKHHDVIKAFVNPQKPGEFIVLVKDLLYELYKPRNKLLKKFNKIGNDIYIAIESLVNFKNQQNSEWKIKEDEQNIKLKEDRMKLIKDLKEYKKLTVFLGLDDIKEVYMRIIDFDDDIYNLEYKMKCLDPKYVFFFEPGPIDRITLLEKEFENQKPEDRNPEILEIIEQYECLYENEEEIGHIYDIPDFYSDKDKVAQSFDIKTDLSDIKEISEILELSEIKKRIKKYKLICTDIKKNISNREHNIQNENYKKRLKNIHLINHYRYEYYYNYIYIDKINEIILSLLEYKLMFEQKQPRNKLLDKEIKDTINQRLNVLNERQFNELQYKKSEELWKQFRKLGYLEKNQKISERQNFDLKSKYLEKLEKFKENQQKFIWQYNDLREEKIDPLEKLEKFKKIEKLKKQHEALLEEWLEKFKEQTNNEEVLKNFKKNRLNNFKELEKENKEFGERNTKKRKLDNSKGLENLKKRKLY